MIVFDHVTKTYDSSLGESNVGLDDVSVKIDKGDFVFLVGPSGAGKSTFIKLILKEIDADAGSIRVKGNEVTTMTSRKIPKHRRNIGIVFQDFRLLPQKTVYENVAFAMEITHQSKRAIKRNVPQALGLMGISSYADKYPDELSAGEQQRVAIARAIVNKPTVLIADEPTGNLDPVTAWEIMKLLEEINMRGTTIVMVTHAKDIVDRMKKRVIVIENGKIVRDEFGMYGMKGKRLAMAAEESAVEGAEAVLAEMDAEAVPGAFGLEHTMEIEREQIEAAENEAAAEAEVEDKDEEATDVLREEQAFDKVERMLDHE